MHIQHNRMTASAYIRFFIVFLLLFSVFLTGCGDDDDVMTEESQDASIMNDTLAEPDMEEEELPYEELSETMRMVVDAQQEYLEDADLKEELASEITVQTEPIVTEDDTREFEVYTLNHNGNSMKFLMETIGDPDRKGNYPLYITLHGGGSGTPEENNREWRAMFSYYKSAVHNGIYIAVRAITDTWDLHFRPESYPLYDRLIQAMIMNYHVDPDRVYLLGFSAGGDGVYQIAPRMADRFAAVNMSSGHPNGVSLLNTANLPFSIQAGIRDFYDEDAMRSLRAAEFEETFQKYNDTYGFGYEHRIYIHVPDGHNYDDYGESPCLVLKDPQEFAHRCVPEGMMERFLSISRWRALTFDVMSMSYFSTGLFKGYDKAITRAVEQEFGLETVRVNADAVAYVNQFRRDHSPSELVWDLSTRADQREITSFYWLSAEPEVNEGVIHAWFDADTNSYMISVDEEPNGDFTILLDPRMVDFSRPVNFLCEKGEFARSFTPSKEMIDASIRESGDPQMLYAASIRYSELN